MVDAFSTTNSNARSRDAVNYFVETAPSFNDQRVFLIDGTTFAIAPVAELQKEYPPASYQYGQVVWPIAYVVLAHELGSGAALPPEIGAMYREKAVSETRLAQTLMKRLSPSSIVMIDNWLP